jgi:hypothetical protein
MKTIKLLFTMLALTLSFAPDALAVEELKANEKQMLGLWEEYAPGSNCVEFFDNHTMKIYLTEEEGKDSGGDHFVQANWSLDEKNVMTLTIAMGEQSFKQSAQVVFENGEMWLKEQDGSTTKNRRIKAIPAKYKW